MTTLRALVSGFRGRLVAYVVLAALIPVGAGVVAFGRWAAESERNQMDSRLHAVLQAAGGALERELARAQMRATELASRPDVQRALADTDRAALLRIADNNRGAAFADRRRSLVADDVSDDSLRRWVEVDSEGRTIGRVAVGVPLDDALLGSIADRVRLSPDESLALVRRGTVIAGPFRHGERFALEPGRAGHVRLSGTDYRAHAARVVDDSGATALAALRPREDIESAVSDVWRDAILGGLAVLGILGVVAFAAAPAVERGRLTLEQRVHAARALANVADGVLLLDSDGRIRFVNPAAETILGLSADGVRDRNVAEAIAGWTAVASVIPVGAPGASAHVRPATLPFEARGREIWLSISGADFEDGRVYAFRDVTDERQLEELKSHFVATVSHELRTPLAAVYGSAMTLRRGTRVGPERRERLLSVIAEQTDRLAWIIEDILLASQLASGTLRMANETFDAVEAARGVVETARARLPEGLEIELDAPDSLPAVWGDSSKAGQVLANIVDNAIKYSPDGGRIDVRLRSRDGNVCFSVSDEGIGVPPTERERIFEKFYRLDPEQTGGVGGTGLGLYICRELVRQMGGRIWFTPRPERGSTFAFELRSVEVGAETVVPDHARAAP